MFIKVDESGNILAHSTYPQIGLDISVDSNDFLDSNGLYKFKYINNELISIPENERTNHPIYKSQMLTKLKALAKDTIEKLDEGKAHSIAIKKAEGIVLTYEEQAFLTAFLASRQEILNAYEQAKQAYI